MRPDLTALLDQAAAAGRETHCIFVAMAQHPDVHLRGAEVPGPITRQLLERMHHTMLTRALNGQPTMCEHLNYTAPRTAVWLAYAPGKLRCQHCAGASARRIQGTREDRRCDHCQHIRSTIHPATLELPPVIVDISPALAIPPILAMFGLCPDCHAANAERTTQ